MLNLLQEIQELKATCGHLGRKMNSPETANPNLVEPPNSALTGEEPDKQYRKTSTPAKDCTGVSNVNTKQVEISLINEAEEQAETWEHLTPSPQECLPQ